jgi:hypothetical protein
MKNEDDMEATAYVAANLLYMYGVAEQPDVRHIDHELGPDQTIRGHVARYLLGLKFNVQTISPYDPRQFLADEVKCASSENRLSSSVSPPVTHMEQILGAYEEAPSRAEYFPRDVTFKDITEAIAHNRTVLLPWGQDNAPVLVYGVTAHDVQLWYPYWDQPCLQRCSYRRFKSQWQFQLGVEIFWR